MGKARSPLAKPEKLTFSHLKMDGWNTFSFPFRMAYSQGLWLLVSGSVATWDFEETIFQKEIVFQEHFILGNVLCGKNAQF